MATAAGTARLRVALQDAHHLCGREDLPGEPLQNLCCHCRYRTIVRDRPIFDTLAHAPGQPFACNLKIAMPAASRVVRQTVVDLLARYDKANHSQLHPGGCLQLADLFSIAHRPGKTK